MMVAKSNGFFISGYGGSGVPLHAVLMWMAGRGGRLDKR